MKTSARALGTVAAVLFTAKRGEPPLHFRNDIQIPLAMSDQISTPLACRVGLAGVVLPYRAFKLRNELPDLVHGSCRAGYEMVPSLSG